MILGNNIFYDHDFTKLLLNADSQNKGATTFACHVNDPERYGIAEFDKMGKISSLEQKPKIAKSNYAVTSLYFYDSNAVNFARSLRISSRGKFEITDLNNLYLKENNLFVEIMGRGDAWLCTETHEFLLEASSYVDTIEHRQGLWISCLKEMT